MWDWTYPSTSSNSSNFSLKWGSHPPPTIFFTALKTKYGYICKVFFKITNWNIKWHYQNYETPVFYHSKTGNTHILLIVSVLLFLLFECWAFFKAGINLESIEQIKEANLIIIMDVIIYDYYVLKKFLSRNWNGVLKWEPYKIIYRFYGFWKMMWRW